MSAGALFAPHLPRFDESRSSLQSFARPTATPPTLHTLLRKIAAAQDTVTEHVTTLEDALKSLDRRARGGTVRSDVQVVV